MQTATTLIGLVILTSLLCDANGQSLRIRGPGRRLLRPRDRDSSIKSSESSEYHQTQDRYLQSPEEPSDDKEKDCKGMVDKEIGDSFNALSLVGDKDIQLSFHEKHQRAHCDDAKQQLKIFENHVKCVKGVHGKVLRLIGNDFKHAVRERCVSKTWHDKYIKFSRCVNDTEVINGHHSCRDDLYRAYAYLLKNIPEKDQASSVCCVLKPYLRCIRDNLRGYCTKQAADFMVSVVSQPMDGFIDYVCKGKFEENCSEKYPEALDEIDKIFEYKEEPKHLQSYKLLFKLIQNQFDVDNY